MAATAEITKDIVNRDPFAPVRLATFMDSGRPTDKVYIQIQDEDGGWAVPTGTAVVHGSGYRLISNQAMHDMMSSVVKGVEEAHGFKFQPLHSYGANSQSILWNGRSYCERWYTDDVNITTPQGSKVSLGIEARNSYDRSSCAQLGFFAMHVTCQNQFHSRNLFGHPFKVTHVGKSGELDEDIADAIASVTDEAANFGRILPKINSLSSAHLFTMQEYLDFFDECEKRTGLVINDVKIRRELHGEGPTSKVKGLNVDYSSYGDHDSLWAIVNAFTAVTTHDTPGMYGADKSARFVDFAIEYAEKIAVDAEEV